MDTTASDFVLAGSLKQLKDKGRLVVHGRHRPVLLVHEGGHVFALDNRCPHMGFPLDRGSVEDGILTCHWHHARSRDEGSVMGLDRRDRVVQPWPRVNW